MPTSATLPQSTPDMYLTDGGLETTLLFLEGFDLPSFAAFDLLKEEKGYNAIKDYYKNYLDIARKYQTAFILESPTWRANPDWIEKLGYPASAIRDVNTKAIQLLIDLKEVYKNDVPIILISGCIGPRGDGYRPTQLMRREEAKMYHAAQIEAFSKTAVDLITAITMNYAEEAIGITQAANAVNLPVVISFTLETDGKLATGIRLKEAIEQVDANVKTPPIYYMINCAHSTHFMNELIHAANEGWTKRIHGIRANASCKSHAELDESTELDRGHPVELATAYKKLKMLVKHLNVFGGCCGTDEEHVQAIASQVTSFRNEPDASIL